MMNGSFWSRCGIVAVLGMAIGGLAGCGPSAPTGEVIETAPAAGVLTYNGEPLAYHKVTVMPAEGRPAMGISDELGLFTLGTNDTGDGAITGTHPVAVAYVGPPSDDPEEGINKFTPPPPPEVKIDKKYENPETSGLTVTIPEDGDNNLGIDLK